MENHSERNQRTFKWIERQTVLIRRFNPANSVQFSCSVMPNSLQPHGLQHDRLPWPSPTPRVYSNSCPLSQWCHPTISSPAIPFPSRLQSFLASGSFQMSQLFTSGGQRIGVSAHHQSFQWIFRTDFLLDGLAGSPCYPRDSQESSPTPQFKTSIFLHSAFFIGHCHIHTWLLEKP